MLWTNVLEMASNSLNGYSVWWGGAEGGIVEQSLPVSHSLWLPWPCTLEVGISWEQRHVNWLWGGFTGDVNQNFHKDSYKKEFNFTFGLCFLNSYEQTIEEYWSFLGGSVEKNPPANSGFDPWIWKVPCRRIWQPTGSQESWAQLND